MKTTILVPGFIVRGPNTMSRNWAYRAKLRKDEMDLVASHLENNAGKMPWLPYKDPGTTVHLIRYGKRRMDFDNLVAGLKHTRDLIADRLWPGLAKGRADEKIAWVYDQVTPAEYALEIRVHW